MKVKRGNRITDERNTGAGDIQTHCGFKEPADWFQNRCDCGGGGAALINRKCDAFFAKRNMEWFARPFGQGDYYPKAR